VSPYKSQPKQLHPFLSLKNTKFKTSFRSELRHTVYVTRVSHIVIEFLQHHQVSLKNRYDSLHRSKNNKNKTSRLPNILFTNKQNHINCRSLLKKTTINVLFHHTSSVPKKSGYHFSALSMLKTTSMYLISSTIIFRETTWSYLFSFYDHFKTLNMN